MEKQVEHRINSLERFYGEDSSIKGFAAAYLAYIGRVISKCVSSDAGKLALLL